MIRITALGAIAVSRDETGSSSLTGQQPKRLALLAYLVATHARGPQRRDSIVALLWPELDQERARAALRQALYGIRKSLGADPFVLGGTESLSLDAGLVTCDLWELDRAT